MAAPPQIFDQVLWRRRLDRAARSADMPDFLLRRVEADLAERLAIVKRPFRRAACLGAYSSTTAKLVFDITGAPDIMNVAVGGEIARGIDPPAVLADPGIVPFEVESLDLIVSCLTLQFENDLPGVLVQARRALKPDGLFLAAIIGGQSLNELRTAWLIAEEEVTGGASPRVAPFADVRDCGALLQRAGFALPVVDSDTLTVNYSSPLALMQELKAMGASNVLAARRRVPVTRGLLLRAAEVYASRFANAEGRIPATFEIITMTAWAPDASQPKPLKPGSAAVSLADVLGKKPGN